MTNRFERMRERYDRHGMVSTKDWSWLMIRVRLLEEIANAADVYHSAYGVLTDAIENFNRAERGEDDESL